MVLGAKFAPAAPKRKPTSRTPKSRKTLFKKFSATGTNRTVVAENSRSSTKTTQKTPYQPTANTRTSPVDPLEPEKDALKKLRIWSGEYCSHQMVYVRRCGKNVNFSVYRDLCIYAAARITQKFKHSNLYLLGFGLF